MAPPIGSEIEGAAGIAEALSCPPETLAASESVGIDFTMVLRGTNLVPGHQALQRLTQLGKADVLH
jgi:hypothetical protein